MPSKENVKRLVSAAWKGIEDELLRQNASAEDVVNAAVAICAGAVRYTSKLGTTKEDQAFNRQAVRTALRELILETADDSQVM